MKLLQDWNDELKDTESTAFKALSVRFETEVKTRNIFYLNAFLAELPRAVESHCWDILVTYESKKIWLWSRVRPNYHQYTHYM